MAPVPEKPTITVQEAVARKMLKLRAKLGITPADLLPASVALESEEIFNEKPGANGAQDMAKAEEGGSSYLGSKVAPSPDIGRWRKEAEDMLSLLGTNAEKCTHAYPMMELKQKVDAGESSYTFLDVPQPWLQNITVVLLESWVSCCSVKPRAFLGQTRAGVDLVLFWQERHNATHRVW